MTYTSNKAVATIKIRDGATFDDIKTMLSKITGVVKLIKEYERVLVILEDKNDSSITAEGSTTRINRDTPLKTWESVIKAVKYILTATSRIHTLENSIDPQYCLIQYYMVNKIKSWK